MENKKEENNYKYVVSITTAVHIINEDRDWEEPITSKTKEIEITESNLLDSRKKALEKADFQEKYFAEETENKYPFRKWEEIQEDDGNTIMTHQVEVFLRGEIEELLPVGTR